MTAVGTQQQLRWRTAARTVRARPHRRPMHAAVPTGGAHPRARAEAQDVPPGLPDPGGRWHQRRKHHCGHQAPVVPGGHDHVAAGPTQLSTEWPGRGGVRVFRVRAELHLFGMGRGVCRQAHGGCSLVAGGCVCSGPVGGLRALLRSAGVPTAAHGSRCAARCGASRQSPNDDAMHRCMLCSRRAVTHTSNLHGLRDGGTRPSWRKDGNGAP